MLKKIMIIGSEGSMGKRYQAILTYLGLPFDNSDIKLNDDVTRSFGYSHIILCTPTDTHESFLKFIYRCYSGSILCEKPIIKNSSSVRNLIDSIDISIMFQYAYLIDNNPTKNFTFDSINSMEFDHNYSSYDFFRTGNDGLPWDCMQTISLHRGPLKNLFISNKSPIWTCKINNKILSLSDMDNAYVVAVREWFSGKRFEKDFIIHCHEKVERFIEKKELKK